MPRTEPMYLRFPSMPPRHTAQQKGCMVRNGRPHFFKKASVVRSERNTLSLVRDSLPEGFKPFGGPVAVRVRLCWPYRRTERKRVVESGREVWNAVRPDLDNLAKGILDILTRALVWRDDGQVARLVLEKVWGPSGYWSVEVESLADTAGEEVNS